MDHLLPFHSFCSIHLCHMTPLTTPMNLHCSLCCSSCLAAALSGLSRHCLTKFPSKHLNLMYLFLILFILDSSNDKYSFHRIRGGHLSTPDPDSLWVTCLIWLPFLTQPFTFIWAWDRKYAVLCSAVAATGINDRRYDFNWVENNKKAGREGGL